jgi:glycosyltransferase involved in cell wall biosynthesis
LNTRAITISLVIPTFNRGDLIAETIRSALAQSSPFLDIVVVDDGSTDNTAEALLPFGDRIKVLRLARGGVQAARNAGVALTGGSYIVLCDSDDLLEPDFVEQARACLTLRPETDAFYCNFVTFDENGTHADKFSLAPPGFFDGAQRAGDFLWDVPDLYLRTVGYQPLFISGCLVRKAFYQQLGGFNTAFNNIGGEDWEFTLRAIASGKVALCTSVLARIRKHASNQSGDSIRQVRGTARILEYALGAHPGAGQYQHAIRASIARRRISVFHVAFSRANFEVAEEMLTLLSGHPQDFKFRVKAMILKLPDGLRRHAWRLTQP